MKPKQTPQALLLSSRSLCLSRLPWWKRLWDKVPSFVWQTPHNPNFKWRIAGPQFYLSTQWTPVSRTKQAVFQNTSYTCVPSDMRDYHENQGDCRRHSAAAAAAQRPTDRSPNRRQSAKVTATLSTCGFSWPQELLQGRAGSCSSSTAHLSTTSVALQILLQLSQENNTRLETYQFGLEIPYRVLV